MCQYQIKNCKGVRSWDSYKIQLMLQLLLNLQPLILLKLLPLLPLKLLKLLPSDWTTIAPPATTIAPPPTTIALDAITAPTTTATFALLS